MKPLYCIWKDTEDRRAGQWRVQLPHGVASFLTLKAAVRYVEMARRAA